MKRGRMIFVVLGILITLPVGIYSGGILNTESSISAEKASTLKVLKDKEKEAKKAIDTYKKVAAKKLVLIIGRYWLQSRVKIVSHKNLLDTQMTNRTLSNTKQMLSQSLKI